MFSVHLNRIQLGRTLQLNFTGRAGVDCVKLLFLVINWHAVVKTAILNLAVSL
jgi:hypothetical protein